MNKDRYKAKQKNTHHTTKVFSLHKFTHLLPKSSETVENPWKTHHKVMNENGLSSADDNLLCSMYIASGALFSLAIPAFRLRQV